MDYIFLDSFREGDYMTGIFALLLLLVIIVLVAGMFWSAWREYQWHIAREFTIDAVLLSAKVKPSTLQSHAVPVVTSNGAGVGVVSTGEDEKRITVWDCGQYGRLVSYDDEVFRWATERASLRVKELHDEIRIVRVLR